MAGYDAKTIVESDRDLFGARSQVWEGLTFPTVGIAEKRSDCRIEELAEKLKLGRQEELGRSARIHIQHILHCPKDTYLFHRFRN